jgi:hypothetical protein
LKLFTGGTNPFFSVSRFKDDGICSAAYASPSVIKTTFAYYFSYQSLIFFALLFFGYVRRLHSCRLLQEKQIRPFLPALIVGCVGQHLLMTKWSMPAYLSFSIASSFPVSFLCSAILLSALAAVAVGIVCPPF